MKWMKLLEVNMIGIDNKELVLKEFDEPIDILKKSKRK